jgi:hypothetical protein
MGITGLKGWWEGLALLLVWGSGFGCSGRTGEDLGDSSNPPEESPDAPASSTPGTERPAGIETLAPEYCDDEPEARRAAREDEQAEYCVCGLRTVSCDEMDFECQVEAERYRWICYGPSPDDPPEGGARGAPPAQCPASYLSDGDDGNCFISRAGCSDGHTYGLYCREGHCICLVDGLPSPLYLEVEPRSTCPSSLDDLNAVCGWALTEGGGASAGTGG